MSVHSTIHPITSPALTTRFENYIAAQNSHDVPHPMALMSSYVDFSDYFVCSHHMDKPALTALMTNMNEICGDMTIIPRSCHDSESFTTWEWDFEFKYLKESPTLPGVEGKGQTLTPGWSQFGLVGEGGGGVEGRSGLWLCKLCEGVGVGRTWWEG